MNCMEDSSNQRDPRWHRVFDELAAFRDRVFAKVGQRPHTHREEGTLLDCAVCSAWQKRFDAVFQEELDKFKHP
jgi:hypothetical protein